MTSEMRPVLAQLKHSKVKPSKVRPSKVRPSKVKPAMYSDKGDIGLPLYYGARINNVSLVIALAGIGDNAGKSTSRLLEFMPFGHAIIVGVAGGIDPDLKIGDVVVPTLVTDLDTGKSYEPTLRAGKANCGTLLTSSTVLTDEQRLMDLGADGIAAIDMETATIARACSDKGVPWSVYRGISDLLPGGPVNNEIIKLVHSDGTTNLGAVSKYLLGNPSRVKVLTQLGRDTALAARAAARAALAAVKTL